MVGIGVLNTQVVQDDIDQGHTGYLLRTPALAREFNTCCSSLTYDGLQLSLGSRSDLRVSREYAALVKKKFKIQNAQLQVYETSVIEADAERAIRPEATALGMFDGIAFLATFSCSRPSRSAGISNTNGHTAPNRIGNPTPALVVVEAITAFGVMRPWNR